MLIRQWQPNTVYLLHPAMTTAVVTIRLFVGHIKQRAVLQIEAAKDIVAQMVWPLLWEVSTACLEAYELAD